MTEIAGLTEATRDALEHVRSIEPPAVANHSIRTFLYGQAAADAEGDAVDIEALWVACLFHDSGIADENDGDQRFEVEGADAAVRFLTGRGWPAERERAVWNAIALHTSPGIAERFDPVTRFTRRGVLIDFGAVEGPVDGMVERVEKDYARLDVEVVLGDAIVRQALSSPAKAPRNSWPGGLLRAHLADPEHVGVNPAF